MTDAAPTAPPPTIEEYLAALPEGMGALNERMGIRLVEISADRVVATMPVEGNTQPYGLLHGGASVVLAETLGSVGAGLHGHPDRIPVGVDINATHHRAVRSGTLTGVATASTAGGPWRRTRSSSATSRTAGSAPPASPARCSRSAEQDRPC